MELKRVIIAYKAGHETSRKWAIRCAHELETRDIKVLMGPSGFKDNPYPVFLASSTSKIDLAIILGGDGTTLAAARHLAPENIPFSLQMQQTNSLREPDERAVLHSVFLKHSKKCSPKNYTTELTFKRLPQKFHWLLF